MNKKTLLTSLMSIAMLISVGAGATYALFTSDSEVNIAVNSATVNYKATIEGLDLYSPAAISLDGKVVDDTDVATETTFVNGGTVKLEGGNLTLTNMTPGDKVTFKVNVVNNSTVLTKHQTVITQSNDTGLFAGLKVTINGKEYDGSAIRSDWIDTEVGVNPESYAVEIELPADATNEYQGKSVNLSVSVSAVQGNATVENDKELVVKDDATLAEAIELKRNYTVEDGEFTKTIVSDAVEVTINGGTFKNQVIAARNGGVVTINNAKAGSAESGGGPNILANISSGSTVVINGGSYMTSYIFYGDGTGTAIITGGYFDCGCLYITVLGKPVADLMITGGTFNLMQGMASLSDFVPDTHQIVNNTDGSCTVIPK